MSRILSDEEFVYLRYRTAIEEVIVDILSQQEKGRGDTYVMASEVSHEILAMFGITVPLTLHRKQPYNV